MIIFMIISLFLAISIGSDDIILIMTLKKKSLAKALSFALVQLLFLSIGVLIGNMLSGGVKEGIEILASIGLILLGIQGFREGLKMDEEGVEAVLKKDNMLLLWIIGNIDAMIVSFSLHFSWIQVVTIFSWTLILSIIALMFGKKLEKTIGKKLDIIAGGILVILGLVCVFEIFFK